MIGLGVVPGLSSLGYCVADVPWPVGVVNPLDFDILAGSRLKNSLSSLAKKANVHRLVFDVVLDRIPPAVIALGPALENCPDPPEHIEAVKYMIRTLGQHVRIPVVELTMQQVCQSLNVSEGNLPKTLRKHLKRPIAKKDRRLIFATAYAVAGVLAITQVPA